MVLSIISGSLRLMLPKLLKSCRSTGSRRGRDRTSLCHKDGSMLCVLVEVIAISARLLQCPSSQ